MDFVRKWNISNNIKYINSLKQGIIPCKTERLSLDQRFNEYILNSLRTSKGCSLIKVKKEFGEGYLEKLIENSQNYIETMHLKEESQKLISSNK